MTNPIRRAEPRDIPDLTRLLVQVNMVHHNGRPDLFKGPATKYTEAELREILRDDQRPIFVWTDEAGNVRGYAFSVFEQIVGSNLRTDVKTLYIDDLCVDEQARGQGIGKDLYEFVVKFARESGCYNLTLNVWAANPGAMRFYEKCGLIPQKIGMEKIL